MAPYYLARYVTIPLIRRLRPEAYADRLLPELLKTQWLRPEQLVELQLSRLRRLLEHAWDQCPFHRSRMEQAGLVGGTVDSIEDYRKLPVLTRREIQAHREEMVARDYDRALMQPQYTGGSTGDPLHFYREWGENNSHLRSREHRANLMAGWDYGLRTLKIWGAGLDVRPTQTLKGRLLSWTTNHAWLDCTSLDDQTIDRHLQRMRRYRPDIIEAYSTVAYLFATRLLEQGGADWPCRAVIGTVETMTDPQRRTIERAFGCGVFDRYGSREVGAIAAECEEHRGKHVGIDELVVEIVDDEGRPVPPGQEGNLVVTDLFNYAMPFLRYAIGDTGTLTDEPCPCGRGFPLLVHAVGRESDIIRLPSGRRLTCAAFVNALAHDLKGIANLQMVRKGETEFELRVMKGPDFAQHEMDYLRRHVDDLFGSEAKVTYKFVDKVIRTANGKYRFLVSDLPSDGVE